MRDRLNRLALNGRCGRGSRWPSPPHHVGDLAATDTVRGRIHKMWDYGTQANSMASILNGRETYYLRRSRSRSAFR